MTVIASWLRLEVRRRWRSLTMLALLIAVASATVMAALAGARRGVSAQQRLDESTLPATAVISPNSPGFDWAKLRRLPEVAALAPYRDALYTIDGADWSDDAGAPSPADAAMLRAVERPAVLTGRVPDPSRPDEAVVTPKFVDTFHKGVGDTVLVQLGTPAQAATVAAGGDIGPLRGPRIITRIVGVIRSPYWSDTLDTQGTFLPSAGLAARYPANTVGKYGIEGALVRLRDGESDLPAFRAHLAGVTRRADIDVKDLPGQRRDRQRLIAFQSGWLLAFGVAAFLAGAVLVGQAVARHTAREVAELRVVRALGMTLRQAVGAAAAAPVLAGVVGVGVGSVAATVASPRFPIGLAELYEPAPGARVDWVVLGAAIALVPVLVLAGAAASALLALGVRQRHPPGRRSSVARLATRAGLPVPVVVGTRFALESGARRSAVPVRPALLGGVVGVLGIAAAATISHAVSDAGSHPARFGQSFQLEEYIGLSGHDLGPAHIVLAGVVSDPDVAAVNDARTAVAEHRGRGAPASVSLYSYAPVGAPMDVVLTAGRMPATAHEVVLAPRTASDLDATVGEQVRLIGTRGTAALAVTGIGFVPGGSQNSYSSGGWVTRDGFDALFDGFAFHTVEIQLRPGSDVRRVAARLPDEVAATALAITGDRALSEAARTVQFAPPHAPDELAMVKQMRTVPAALAIFLALVALGAVGHVMVIAVGRRAHDLAVLRAVGMTRRQARAVIATQASVLAIIAVVLGVPLGLAAGRSAWRLVAAYGPLDYVAPLATTAMAVIAPAVLVSSILLATWPARRAARLHVAQVLRAE